MKKILSVIVSLVMSVGLMSVNVHAAADPYIVINDIYYYDTTASGDGWTFSREGTEGTLKLTNASIIAHDEAIASYFMNLTIELSGSNEVTRSQAGGCAIYLQNGDLTIQGDGSLDVSGSSTGITVLVSGHLKITGKCTVTVTVRDAAIYGRNGITIGEGLGIIAPAGARISDDGTIIVDKDGNTAKETTIGPATVTITFDANGGTPATTIQTIAKGGKATAPDPEPTLEKFYLWDWYETADHSGDPVDFSTKTFDSDTTLYAGWAKRLFFSAHNPTGMGSSEYGGHVTMNGRTFSNMAAQKFKDETITLSVEPYEGYGFIGFAYSEDDEIITDQMPYTIVNDGTWEEIYALFGPLKTITFVDEDGTVLQTGPVAIGKTPEYTGDTPTKKADKNYTYTFDKWDPEITEVTEDATYTATYKKKKKSSSSSSNSSSSTTTTTTTTDNTWTDTSTTTSSTTTYTPPVTPSYRPQPTTTAYTVWFETDGGTEIAYQTVAAGTTASRPYDPEKEGYLFDGWYSGKELTEEFDFLTPINANTTVYAKWAEPEEEPEEIIPEPTEEPEPEVPEDPEVPARKPGKPWMWPLLALILAVLGAGGWKLTRH